MQQFFHFTRPACGLHGHTALLFARQFLGLMGCAVLAAVLLAAQPQFYALRTGNVGFVAATHSPPLTADALFCITLSPLEASAEGLCLRFVPPGEGARSPVHAVLRDSATGTVLAEGRFAALQLDSAQYLTLLLGAHAAKGRTLVLTLESDETDPAHAVRLAAGHADRTDVPRWQCSGAAQPGTPDVTLQYRHYGLRSMLACTALLCLGALACLAGPRLQDAAKQHAAQTAEAASRPYPLRLACTAAWGGLLLWPFPALYVVERLNRGSVLGLSLPASFGNLVLCWGLSLLLLALTGRTGAATTLAAALCLGLGVGNYYLTLYRSTVLLPTDLAGLGTAGNVLGSYALTPDVPVLLAVCLFWFLACAGGAMSRRMPGRPYRAASGHVAHPAVSSDACPDAQRGSTAPAALRRLALRTLCAAAGLFLLCFPAVRPEAFSAPLALYTQTVQARQNGFLLNFAANVPLLLSRTPEGYDAGALTDFVPAKGLPEKSSLHPNVIVIMNESFADITDLLPLETNVDILPTLHALVHDPAAFVGRVAVPVYGGGTSCTEYELLTGFSTALDDANLAPYLTWFRRETPTLVRTFQKSGYRTAALHPAPGKNWYRRDAYPHMGFDDIRFLDSFARTDTLRGFTTDAFGYGVLLRQLKAESAPLFAFNVTIQNHGSYSAGLGETAITAPALPEVWRAEGETYLSLLHLADAALGDFLRALGTVDEPTVVLFFGDHWSCFDETRLAQLGCDPAAFTADETLAYHSTPYILWSNCGLDFSAAPANTSANYLGAILIDRLGLAESPWVQFLLGGAWQWPVLSRFAVRSAAQLSLQGGAGEALPGELAAPLPLAEYARRYACLQYNALSGHGGVRWEIFG